MILVLKVESCEAPYCMSCPDALAPSLAYAKDKGRLKGLSLSIWIASSLPAVQCSDSSIRVG